jgi:hypothetical protein
VSNLQGENEKEDNAVCVEGSSNEEAEVPFCNSIEALQAAKRHQCFVEQHSARCVEAIVKAADHLGNRVSLTSLQSRLSTSYH